MSSDNLNVHGSSASVYKGVSMLGKKIGMTRFFKDDGTSLPVTIVQVSGNHVLKKTDLADCSRLLLSFDQVKPNRISKPLRGVFTASGVLPARMQKEFSVESSVAQGLEVGKEVPASVFHEGQLVDVTGTTIGKGFTGTIKRHNFSSQRASHGNSRSHNVPGSISMAQDPGRVFPGKKMSGHDGDLKRTVQNLELVKVDADRGLLWVKGAVPGAKNTLLVVKSAVKALAKRQA